MGIGREVEVLLDNVLHRFPPWSYVLRHTPRSSDLCSPCSGEVPSADVQPHVLAASIPDGFGNLGIACLLVERERVALGVGPAPAIVYLDEVEAKVAKEEVAVLLVVAIEPHPNADGVGIVYAAAGVTACIAVDASFQT